MLQYIVSILMYQLNVNILVPRQLVCFCVCVRACVNVCACARVCVWCNV